MTEIKVGDRVRLVGESWDDYEEDGTDIRKGAVVTVTEVREFSGEIWAGDAGTVGNHRGLYTKDNPEPSGDYRVELISESAGAGTLDNGEMIVIRHEYEDVWTNRKGEEQRELQNDAYYAIREPISYDLSNSDAPHAWMSYPSFKIPGDIHLSGLGEVAAYRKLLDAVEARLVELGAK